MSAGVTSTAVDVNTIGVPAKPATSAVTICWPVAGPIRDQHRQRDGQERRWQAELRVARRERNRRGGHQRSSLGSTRGVSTTRWSYGAVQPHCKQTIWRRAFGPASAELPGLGHRTFAPLIRGNSRRAGFAPFAPASRGDKIPLLEGRRDDPPILPSHGQVIVIGLHIAPRARRLARAVCLIEYQALEHAHDILVVLRKRVGALADLIEIVVPHLRVARDHGLAHRRRLDPGSLN